VRAYPRGCAFFIRQKTLGLDLVVQVPGTAQKHRLTSQQESKTRLTNEPTERQKSERDFVTMSGSKQVRALQRREFLRLSGGALALAATGGALAGCGGGSENDPFSNLPPGGGSSPGTGSGQQSRILVAQNPLSVGMDRGQSVAQVATLQNVQGRNYEVFAVPDAQGLPRRIVQTHRLAERPEPVHAHPFR
jgi:hypothetical protein